VQAIKYLDSRSGLEAVVVLVSAVNVAVVKIGIVEHGYLGESISNLSTTRFSDFRKRPRLLLLRRTLQEGARGRK
jgi:hypothetical protein